jgi:hypothetical protein
MPITRDCCKWILDEQGIPVNPNGLSSDASRAKGKGRIGDFDRNPIEAAVWFVERLGDTVGVLTCGTPAAKQSLGIPWLFERYPHVTHEALKFIFTVDGKVPEKVTKAICKYPGVSFGMIFRCG